MGLEMLMAHNRVLDKLHLSGMQLEDTNGRLLIGFGMLFMYMLVGAVVFTNIEGEAELIEHNEYAKFRSSWQNYLVNEKGVSEDEVDRLFAGIRDSSLAGVWQEKNVTSDLNWTIPKSFLFAGCLLSTIGYGNTSPKTRQGKIFTIVYCLIGIPITLTLLGALSARLLWPSTRLRTLMNLKLGTVFHSKHLQIIHLGTCFGVLIFVAFILPSLILCAIEKGLNFIDAFYFCFISLTTIGIGQTSFDSVPSVLVTVYLIFGLGCMLCFLAILNHVPQFQLLSRYFITKSDEDNEAEVKPVHMHNGGPSYGRYNEPESPGNSDVGMKEVLGTCVKEALTNKSSKYYIDDFGLDLMFHAIVYCASENNVPDVALMFNSLLFVKNTTETDWQCIEEFTDEVHAASQHIESFGKNMTKKERNTFCQITNDLSKTICSMRKECGRSDSVDAIGVFAYAKFHFDANNGVENSNE
ncbi:Two pore potassium channel protein sup-9 [Aphelenchoides besseyi]|nr:Two pore potassium channel protein sup-9 [Aphelenchoides besseyi]KAI6200298.1 Two pore potassium channel protein sup-9 [Aphelenchoides besseyi]